MEVCRQNGGMQSVDSYQKDAFNVQLASSLLLLVSAVALAIILATLPHSSNYPALITLGAIGGVAFVTLMVASCAYFLVARKGNKEREVPRHEEIPPIDEIAPPPKEEDRVVTVTLEEKPIEYLKQVLVQPIVNAFQGAVKGTIVADCATTAKDRGDKLARTERAVREMEALLLEFFDNPKTYVSELLRCYGPGKKNITIVMRRMITAHNAGNDKILKDVLDEFQAICCGCDFSDVEKALKKESNENLMRQLPALLENHFCVANPPLKELGRTILDAIFEKARTQPKALQALEQLKKKVSYKGFADEVEKFLNIILDEAQVSKELYEQWSQQVIKRLVNTTLKKTICGALGTMARNMRLLSLMLDKQKEKKELFTSIDKTFLLSESEDCIVQRRELQEDLFELQNVLNYDRSDKKRIAFIALPEENTQGYDVLKKTGIYKLFFDANPCDFKELEKINKSPEVVALSKKHHVRLVALPVTINDHPFKIVKNYEGTIRVAAALLKPFAPRLIKPYLLNMLPRMDATLSKRFEALFGEFLNLLIDPIYDGAIAETKFAPGFKRVITTKGEELANAIDGLLQDKEVNFEKIRDVWTKAVRGVAEEFLKEGKT